MTSPISIRKNRLSPAIGQIFRPIELPSGQTLHIKIEGYRTDASIKEKPAREMLADGLERGVIDPRVGVIETSSGNTARALARLGAEVGIPVTLVVDPNVTNANVAVMQAFGAKVIHVSNRDAEGGYQKSRIARVLAECETTPNLHWINQYDNPGNARAHMKTTAPEIHTAMPDVTRVYCAVGTGGTATGLGRYFAAVGNNTKVVGCDAVGSVTFGGPSGPRFISGPGNSFVPENWDANVVFATQYVPEAEAVASCRWLSAKHGMLLGGSSGLVIAGAIRHLTSMPPDATGSIVIIAADTGEKYLDQIWNDNWVETRFGLDAVASSAVGLGILE